MRSRRDDTYKAEVRCASRRASDDEIICPQAARTFLMSIDATLNAFTMAACRRDYISPSALAAQEIEIESYI